MGLHGKPTPPPDEDDGSATSDVIRHIKAHEAADPNFYADPNHVVAAVANNLITVNGADHYEPRYDRLHCDVCGHYHHLNQIYDHEFKDYDGV
jgi:hypothetical protein